MFKNALVSVSEKAGLIEFLKPFVERGMRVVSTGGTAQHLRAAGFNVVDVSEQTGHPEVMDGRVKTLHPRIHIPLLCRDGNKEDDRLLALEGLEPFDLVVGNLYPFEKKALEGLEDEALVEFIDVGGPSLLRAAAKSYHRVCTVCDPKDYEWILKKGELTLEDRRSLAAKVFSHTSCYDALVSRELGLHQGSDEWSLGGDLIQVLRYGENPQQKGSWFRAKGQTFGVHQAEKLQGKELSYNNLLDIHSAVSTLREFNETAACVAVKHNSPCGVALSSSVELAIERCLKADPVSVFGGIIAVNHPVNEVSARVLNEVFLECLVAPEFSQEALSVLSKKKNLRLLKWPQLMTRQNQLSRREPEFRSILGGFLVQECDEVSETPLTDWKIIGNEPPAHILKDLLFAWKVCAHLKSNAIAIVEKAQTLGLGMGQVNRVDAVEQALGRMRKFHAQASEPVLSSDAFFPFADSIEMISRVGVKYVIQPGGSLRDEEVISKAQELGINMVLTGRRHFLH